MSDKTTKKQKTPNLIPNRHPQGDLFICDVADVVLKDLTAQMEHPFYSLSKKPDTVVRRYEHNGNWLEVVPSVKGLATIYDKDILIYCISKLMQAKNKNAPISRKVRINAYDLLVFTNRGTSGRDYMALCEALDRLDGTRIRTNIRYEDREEEEFGAFGLIESASVARKLGSHGRLLWCEITLSEWLFNAIEENDCLTLNRDYFRLRKPLERRIYEIARKHCGKQVKWEISTNLLHKKSGSKSPLKHFRYLLRALAKTNHLPDYVLSLDENLDKVIFHNRQKNIPKIDENSIYLSSDIYEEAKIIAPGWDIHFLEQEWLEWQRASSLDSPKNPGRAFLGFCKKKVESSA